MNQSTNATNQKQQLYWNEFVQLKADTCYVRDYRNSIGKWVDALAILRKFTSMSGVGAWLVWKKYAWIWALIIAISQFAEVIEGAIPLYKRRVALSRWSRTLDKLFVETQRNWDEVASGQCTKAEIRKLCHQLRSRKERAEAKYIPNGLTKRDDLFSSAQTEAEKFFIARYNLQ